MPYAAVQLPPFPLWLLLGYYAIVVGGWLVSLQE
jgi:competence protein ComEC